MQHLTSMWDLAAGDVEAILTLSIDLKARFLAGERPALLAGHVLAQVFEKPSLRTRPACSAGTRTSWSCGRIRRA